MLNIYSFTSKLENFELPDFTHNKYRDIESFENYEISNCIAYELAIRNSSFKKTVDDYEDYLLELDEAIIKTRMMRDMRYVERLHFNKQIFYDLGFDDYSIGYYRFRKEAERVEELRNLSHLDLCDFCLKHEAEIENLNEKIQSVVQKYNQNFHRETWQGISCRYIKKYLDEVNYEIHEVNIHEGYFNDTVSDKKLASVSNKDLNPWIEREGLYSSPKDDCFDLSPVEYQTMNENILPTISLIYKRPPLIIATNNKHIYAEINLKLSDEEIMENVKRILEIKKSRESSPIYRNILDSSNMFFEDFVEHEKPKKIRENNLQEYYKILLYTYDTFELFDIYCENINMKYAEGMLLINKQKNKDYTDTNDREEQKKELATWKKYMSNKKIIYDMIYMETMNTDTAPRGTHIINDVYTAAKKLIDNEEYKFLI